MPIQLPLLLSAPQNLPTKKKKKKQKEQTGPKVSGVENYKKTLEMEGTSYNAVKLISMSRRQGFIAGYESACNKWVSWYCQKQIDPFCAPLSEILNFLYHSLKKAYSIEL